MIAEALKEETSDDTRGPGVINKSLVLNYWSLKECSLGSWVKSVLRITKRTKRTKSKHPAVFEIHHMQITWL